MVVRPVLTGAVLMAALLVSPRAEAWQEAHQTGDDVVAHIDPSGVADVTHTIRWHVVRGPLKFIDIVHADPSATLDPDVVITAEDGRTLLGHAARRDDHTVRVTVDEPRSLMRGTFTFEVRWRVNLVTTHALTRDGATWRLAWSSPVASEGFDAAHTVLDFPAAPDPPQPIVADTGAVDDGAVVTLHRQPDRDQLDLVRPHVARGEAPAWTLRIDPRALGQVSDPRLRPASTTAPPEPDRVRETSLAVGLGALALLFGLGVRLRTRAFAAACAACGTLPGRLLPVPDGVRALIAGVALAAGIALELWSHTTLGAACVALAMLAACLRAPSLSVPARGPGRWLALRPEEAFKALDRSWTADVLMAVVFLVVVVGGALLARRFDAEAPWLVVLDSMALLPLLVTGCARQLPPHAARTSAPWLARAFRSLRGISHLRVSPWARIPLESDVPDELRLLVLPRAAMPGLLGIELGLAWSSTPVGWSGAPEVLARVLEGSPAAARLAQELPALRPVPGRRPDERVVRLLPRAPSRPQAVALTRAVAEAFTDRRVTAPAAAWSAQERRVARPRPSAPAVTAAGRAAA
jgi:hypothetical protein